MSANLKSEIRNLQWTRRALFQHAGMGIGALALGSLLAESSPAQGPASEPQAPRRQHLAPRAKSIIFLHMVGAPSQLELFDNKPTLAKFDGQPCPKHLIEGQRFAFLRGHPSLLGPRFAFARHGQSGLELSELLPHLATVADDIAVVKTLHTEQINHGPAQLMFHTGFGRFGRPSVGSWVSYGLGSENRDLPAYVVMVTGKVAGAGSALWGSGFLPSVHQGVEFRSQGDPGALPFQSAGHYAERSAATPRRRAGPQPRATRRRGRSGDRHADFAV